MLIDKYLAFIWVYIDESGEDMTQGIQKQRLRKWKKISPTSDT